MLKQGKSNVKTKGFFNDVAVVYVMFLDFVIGGQNINFLQKKG